MKPPAAASTFASQAVNALLLLALALVLLHTAVNAPSRGVSVSITSVQARFGGAAGPLPETFSWQAYAFWNQAELGNLTQQAAEEHYACTGQRAGRLATTLPLFLSYDGKWGLCNQLFDHVEVLAFARWLNAALPVHATVAAPAAAYSRPASGYKQRFRGDEFQQEPLDSLLDVDRMAAHWADRGLEIAQVGRAKARALPHPLVLAAVAWTCTLLLGSPLLMLRRPSAPCCMPPPSVSRSAGPACSAPTWRSAGGWTWQLSWQRTSFQSHGQ